MQEEYDIYFMLRSCISNESAYRYVTTLHILLVSEF